MATADVVLDVPSFVLAASIVIHAPYREMAERASYKMALKQLGSKK